MELALIGLLYLAIILIVSTAVLFFTAKLFRRPISFTFAFVLTIILLLFSVGGELIALLVGSETLEAMFVVLGLLSGAFMFVYLLRKKYSYATGGNVGLLLVSQIFSGVLAIAITIFFSLSVLSNYMQSYEVAGRSMAPTLEPGDQFTLKKNIEGVNDIEHGDIVVFNSPFANNEVRQVKRAIGLPGDRVVLEDNRLTVHFADSDEVYRPYENQKVFGEDKTTVVAPNSLYVVGDNLEPGASLDSKNDLGLVSFEDVVGVYWFSY